MEILSIISFYRKYGKITIMGIKVSNGYVSSNMSLSELSVARIKLNHVVKEKVEKYSNELVMAKAVWLYDLHTLGITKSKNPIIEAWDEYNKAKLDRIFGCKFYFNQYEDNIYYLYMGSNLYLEDFERIMNVKEFNYIHSFDRPKEFTEDEWNYRYEVWNCFLGFMGDDLNMFTANCWDGYIDIPKKQMIEIPFEKRVQSISNYLKEKDPTIKCVENLVEDSLNKELTYNTLFELWEKDVRKK